MVDDLYIKDIPIHLYSIPIKAFLMLLRWLP